MNLSFMETLQEVDKRIYLEIKKYYCNKIKISFLNNIYRTIKSQTCLFEDLFKYYGDAVGNLFYNSHLIISFDICNHIVGVHNYNTILLDEYKRAQLQNDNIYKEKLIKQVLMQIKMRDYGSMFFENKKILGVENFLFYPPIYYLFYLSNIITKEYADYYDSLTNKKIKLYDKVLISVVRRIRSVFYVIDSDILESAYAIVRGVVELYATYIICKYGTVNEMMFDIFLNAKIDYDCHEEFDADFLAMYQEKKNVEIHSYLNYGWIDGVEEALYLKKDNIYKFSSLTEIVNSLYKKHKKEKSNFGTMLMKYYNKCHIYTHGSTINLKYQIINIMDLCEMCGDILMDLIDEIKPIYKIKLIENVDIVKQLKQFLKELKQKRENITNEQLELYYKQKKNYR